MKSMHTFFSFLMTCFLLLGLVGCGQSGGEESSSPVSSAIVTSESEGMQEIPIGSESQNLPESSMDSSTTEGVSNISTPLQNGETTTTSNTSSSPAKRPTLDGLSLGANKTIKILSHYTMASEYARFEKIFGGKVEETLCSVDDYSSRLSTMISSGMSPDLIVSQSMMNLSPVMLANANVIVKADDYLDYSDPLLLHLKAAYDAGKWKGVHYLAPYVVEPTHALVFNKTLFSKNGYKNPWQLYKEGKWDWNAFRDMANKLNVTNADGSAASFGTTYTNFVTFASSTGIDFVQMGDGKYTVNLNNASITRAMNFLNDMMYKDNIIKLKDPNVWLTYFRRGTLAMQVVDYWMLKGQPEITSAAKKGTLGIAPLPRDPEIKNDGRYLTYGVSSGYCFVKGGKNPQGAALFIKMLAYDTKYAQSNEQVGPEYTYAELKKKGWSDENIEQLKAVSNVDNALISYGYGFMSRAGGWDFLAEQNNWATYVQSILPKVNDDINKLISGKAVS